MRSALVFAALVAAAGAAAAQDNSAEIALWENVRDSKDPVQLRTYLQRYPNGTFAVLARGRLARLDPLPPRAWTLPQSGDNWTYRISTPKRGAKPRSVFVKITSVSPALIVELVSVEGGFTMPWRLARGGYLIPQGVSVLSPYLPQFEKGLPSGEMGYIESTDQGCRDQFVCTAKGTVLGEETVEVPAGRFTATRVVVQQSWRPAAGAKGGPRELARMNGSRTLTIWYANQLKRAVKYESRLTAGDRLPLDADFDLELTAYQVR